MLETDELTLRVGKLERVLRRVQGRIYDLSFGTFAEDTKRNDRLWELSQLEETIYEELELRRGELRSALSFGFQNEFLMAF